MSVFVLVHGAWHGAWCWDRVVPLLEEAGHRAVRLDLPGHNQDKTPALLVTLESYANAVINSLEAHSEPVILVGHSMAGVVITQVAEYLPARIKKLVYLSACLPQDGESLSSVSNRDKTSLLGPNIVMNPLLGYCTVDEAFVKDIFYNDCSIEDFKSAKTRLTPEPLLPLLASVKITPQRFGRVPRIYIECLRDRAISPAFQKKLYTATPCQQVLSLHTGHSPFFSAPEKLVKHLLSLTTSE